VRFAEYSICRNSLAKLKISWTSDSSNGETFAGHIFRAGDRMRKIRIGEFAMFRLTACLILLPIVHLSASVILSIDKLDPSDGIALPAAHIAIIDIFVDVSPNDAWSVGGFSGRAENGARFVYDLDPNSQVVPTAPGMDHRFVTFFSEPSERDADARFAQDAAVANLGGNCYQWPWFSLLEAHFGFIGIPPPNPQTPSRDGYIARIALDLSQVREPLLRTDSARLVVASTPPAGGIPLLMSDCSAGGWSSHGTVAATFDAPPLVGFDWGLYGIPRPAPAWDEANPAPAPRSGHALAYDSARGVTVLFGGQDGSASKLGDTWEWDGVRWRLAALDGPAPRSGIALAYDSIRGVTVLFGGVSSNYTPLGDTWEWNGQVWSQRATTGPAARSQHAMAFDSARGVTVLHGGLVGGSSAADVWAWEGSAWTPRNGGPSARHSHAMAYDAQREVTVLYGGESRSGYASDLWEWNGAAWTHRTGSGPGARAEHAMSYDVARGTTLLFGGNPDQDDLWEWDGVAWSQIVAAGPPGRRQHAMSYDAQRDALVLFGGSNPYWFPRGDLWEFMAGLWTPAVANTPSARPGAVMSYDSARETLVLFGDSYFYTTTDTWEWNGRDWSLRDEGLTAEYPAMAYDEARGVTVLLNGSRTYEWDGVAWTLRSSSGPVARQQPTMAYDAARGVTVLIGVEDPALAYDAETWEWDGSSWTLRAVDGPAPRSGASMAYDRFRQVIVLFGGSTLIDGATNETWEWDGQLWRLAYMGGPAPRSGHRLAYDAGRRVTVMWGGRPDSGTPDAIAWEWTGLEWRAQSAPGPAPRVDPAMAYDAARDEIVLFGGARFPLGGSPGNLSSDTWLFRVPCAGDLDRSGQVGLQDLGILLSNFGTTLGAIADTGDSDRDGDVDLADLVQLLAAFGQECQ
jgi:hypothetical protein